MSLRDQCNRVALAAIGTCALLAACGRDGPVESGPWREEVKLADGRVIVIERGMNENLHRAVADVGFAAVTDATIRIVEPAELAGVPPLTMRYRPIMFDHDSALGTWYAIGVNDRMCIDGFRQGHMDPTGRINLHPNWEYRLIDGRWVEMDMDPSRVGQPTNLLILYDQVKPWTTTHRVVTLEDKATLDSDNRIFDYLKTVMSQVSCG